MFDRFYVPAIDPQFRKIETRLQFQATRGEVDSVFDFNYFKWSVEGLGELYGFVMLLAGSQKPFVVKTHMQIENIPLDAKNERFEWSIDALSVADALQVYAAMELSDDRITWKQEPVPR